MHVLCALYMGLSQYDNGHILVWIWYALIYTWIYLDIHVYGMYGMA